MLIFRRQHLERLCAEKRAPVEAIMPAVQRMDGDVWYVDNIHPAYLAIVAPPKQIAIGDLVAAGLAAVGITPQLVERVTGRKGCGCKQRQRALNEAGFAVQRAAKEFYLGE